MLGIAGTVVVAGAFEDLDEALDEGLSDELSDDGGVETSSSNEANPPPADINDDLSCTAQEVVGAKASGTLTNSSSQLSGYVISVGFVDAAGVRVAERDGIRQRRPGRRDGHVGGDRLRRRGLRDCEIVSVERLAQ